MNGVKSSLLILAWALTATPFASAHCLDDAARAGIRFKPATLLCAKTSESTPVRCYETLRPLLGKPSALQACAGALNEAPIACARFFMPEQHYLRNMTRSQIGQSCRHCVNVDQTIVAVAALHLKFLPEEEFVREIQAVNDAAYQQLTTLRAR